MTLGLYGLYKYILNSALKIDQLYIYILCNSVIICICLVCYRWSLVAHGRESNITRLSQVKILIWGSVSTGKIVIIINMKFVLFQWFSSRGNTYKRQFIGEVLYLLA